MEETKQVHACIKAKKPWHAFCPRPDLATSVLPAPLQAQKLDCWGTVYAFERMDVSVLLVSETLDTDELEHYPLDILVRYDEKQAESDTLRFQCAVVDPCANVSAALFSTPTNSYVVDECGKVHFTLPTPNYATTNPNCLLCLFAAVLFDTPVLEVSPQHKSFRQPDILSDMNMREMDLSDSATQKFWQWNRNMLCFKDVGSCVSALLASKEPFDMILGLAINSGCYFADVLKINATPFVNCGCCGMAYTEWEEHFTAQKRLAVAAPWLQECSSTRDFHTHVNRERFHNHAMGKLRRLFEFDYSCTTQLRHHIPFLCHALYAGREKWKRPREADVIAIGRILPFEFPFCGALCLFLSVRASS